MYGVSFAGTYKLIISLSGIAHNPPIAWSNELVGKDTTDLFFLKQAIPFHISEYLKTFSCSIKWLESMAELINLSFFLFPPPKKKINLKHICFHQVYWTHWRLVRKDSHEHSWPRSTVYRQQESERGRAFTHPWSPWIKVCRMKQVCIGTRERRRRPYKHS